MEESKVLIHFKGYGDEYDEWRPYTPETFPIVLFQPLMLPSPETLNERFSLLSQRVRLEIKKRLRTWRRDDPDVRIEMEIDRDCFDLLKSCGKVVDKQGKDVVIVKDVRKLEPVLGKNSNFRVINAKVDFDYVAEDTEASVCFWLVERIQSYWGA